MPTYEYRCGACGHEFEEFQSMTAPRLRKCPSCKKPALERLIGTGAAVVFKGSGFYQTDYRSESYREAAKKDAEPAKTESGPEAKTEPKSDVKSGTKADSTPGSAPEKAKAEVPKSVDRTSARAAKARGKKSKGTAP
jgi:putative FmdB family regulatory protein